MGSTAGRRRARYAGLAVGVAASGLLTGCTTAADAPVEPAAATAAAPGSDWFLSSGGTGAVTEDHTSTLNGYGDDFYVPQPPRPDLELNIPYSPVGVAPTLSPRPAACGGSTKPRQVAPGVTAGVGSATVTWQADDSSAVTGYRVSAVSQRLVAGTQPAPVQQAVGQVSGCQQLSVTISGLSTGVPYVFWLEELTTTEVPTTVTRWVQVGTSDAVVIG